MKQFELGASDDGRYVIGLSLVTLCNAVVWIGSR
jgi:hypothetical protein